jgi:hypothetical protein
MNRRYSDWQTGVAIWIKEELSIITVFPDVIGTHVQLSWGEHPANDLATDRGICGLKRIKAVRGDQMEVLKILDKSDQSGHRAPIRMSKTTGFSG